jgi:hypothetical protein
MKRRKGSSDKTDVGRNSSISAYIADGNVKEIPEAVFGGFRISSDCFLDKFCVIWNFRRSDG